MLAYNKGVMCAVRTEEQSSWASCGSLDCSGIQLSGQEFCLAHVEEAARAAFLASLQPGSDLDLRGTPIDSDLLAALLEAFKDHEKPRLGNVRFDGARFSGDAGFKDAHFGGQARFEGAQFSGNADFDEAQFSTDARFRGAEFGGYAGFGRTRFIGDAGFDEAQFSRDAWFAKAQFSDFADFDGAQFSDFADFDGAQFSGDATFAGAQFSADAIFPTAFFSKEVKFAGALFSADAWFPSAQFSGFADFDGAQFSGDARFARAQFSGIRFVRAQFSKDASFDRAQFSGDAWFDGAQFTGDVRFDGAQFSGDARFDGAQFSAARVLGPLIVERQLSIGRASFSVPILIELATPRLSLVGTAFQDAANLRVRFAEIVLDGTSFTKPSMISFAESAFKITLMGFELDSLNELKDDRLEVGNRPQRPRLLSIRLVDVSNLVLANLDLSVCLFQGAHNLEKLRIEGPLRFGLTSGIWRQVHVGIWGIPMWRPRTRRQILAEEHHSRPQQLRQRVKRSAERFGTPGWNPPPYENVDWVEKTSGQQVQILSPESLAALYRALRKGLEDQKDAPGAADFYYGEMEMRRHSPTLPLPDRLVLWVYWFFSGYGLRASRALAALAVLIPLFAIGFWLWGLNPPPKGPPPIGYQTALLRSFESATRLLGAAPPGLSEAGQWLDAVLRLIGATLLGLAVFSLRGRIKR